jgi:carbamoyltransferase
MAGGVALNCVANGRVLTDGPFEDVWIQPAAGDAGGALGAALLVWHMVKGHPREADGQHDRMEGACLGPSFSDEEIGAYLNANGYKSRKLSADEWAPTVAGLVERQKVVGLLQGRMEFGPRALGHRSIIGDARSPEMQSLMNRKIKFRESFRPFAPSCLAERVSDFFELDRPSPYMLLVAPVRGERRRQDGASRDRPLRERIHAARSDVPAITHVDYTARVQTVDRETHPRYYDLIKTFEERTGYGILINTSFNVRGEPIVCTPADAYRCFMRTEMDCLVLGSYLLLKEEQPEWHEARDWREDYTLD